MARRSASVIPDDGLLLLLLPVEVGGRPREMFGMEGDVYKLKSVPC